MRSFAKALLPILALASTLAAPCASARGELLPATSSATRNVVAQPAPADAAPVLLTPAQVEALLPATVYFRGKSAPVQLRNAAGVQFGPEAYLLAAMVDTSGYASNVQETYQFYLITDEAVMIGGKRVAPGAYGAGVVNGKLILMDVGGHTLLQADATLDESLRRPRPLQLVSGPGGSLRLYLGRNWIALAPAR